LNLQGEEESGVLREEIGHLTQRRDGQGDGREHDLDRSKDLLEVLANLRGEERR
jgi:hypothetical protein